MALIATSLVALVALIHLLIMVLEMFLWKDPRVYGRFGLTQTEATKIAFLPANQGLYNGFLAAGLTWGLVSSTFNEPIQYFFLACVAIAGIYGAITVRPTTLYIQTLPAALAAIALYFS